MSEMLYPTPGVPYHGEFSSADASALSEANSRFALYPPGDVNAITLGANDYVWITDITITAGAGVTVTVYDGADNSVAAGERIFKGGVLTSTTIYPNYTVGHCCQKGTWPKVVAGAGQVDIQIRGTIQRIVS